MNNTRENVKDRLAIAVYLVGAFLITAPFWIILILLLTAILF